MLLWYQLCDISSVTLCLISLPCSDPGELYSLLTPLVVGRTQAAERCGPRERVLFSSPLKERKAGGKEGQLQMGPTVRESSSAPML